MAGMQNFLDIIKQYDGKEQAELRVRIELPGSFFDGLTSTERAEKYGAEAFEYVPVHHFAKTRHRAKQTCAAIKFLCESDVFDDPQHTGFIMPVTEWNRYRNDTYKNDRAAEAKYIRTVAVVDGQGDGAKASGKKEPERPLIYSQFEFVSAGKHVVKGRDGVQREVACEFWRCRNTGRKCKHREAFKVVSKGTGKMLLHLKKCNPVAYVPIALGSKGSSLELDEAGQTVKRLSFKEMLPDHARFVIMIVLEWDHFNKCRSPSRKQYVKGLKKGSDIPHRATCIKLLRVIRGLMASKLQHSLLHVLSELGPKAIGAQDDIWSMKNCKEVPCPFPPKPP